MTERMTTERLIEISRRADEWHTTMNDVSDLLAEVNRLRGILLEIQRTATSERIGRATMREYIIKYCMDGIAP